MAAGFTTCVLGTYSALTDSFAQVLDLNDRVTYYVAEVQTPAIPKATVTAFNIRTVGEQVLRQQYKNRVITVTLAVKATTPTALDSALTALMQAVEGQLPGTPYYLKLQKPGGSNTRYSKVLYVEHTIPYSAKEYVANAQGGKKRIEIKFTVAPFSFSIPRQTLANAVSNPGFEQGSGPGVQVFNDPLTTTNAYTAATALTYPQAVLDALPLHYFRLGDAVASATALDTIGGGTATVNGGVTFGQTGGVSGDATTAALFNGTTGYVQLNSAGTPTGNGSWSVMALVKVAVIPSVFSLMARWGTAGTNTSVDFGFTNTGKLYAGFGGGSIVTQVSANISTGVYHRVTATYDGTTARLYIDGTLDTSAALAAGAVTGATFSIGAAAGGASSFLAGTLQEVAMFTYPLPAQSITDLNALAAGTFSAGALALASNVLTISHNTRTSFGSPAWGAIQTWQVRYQYATGLQATVALHYTDANNYLACSVGGAGMGLYHVVAGVSHTLSSVTYTQLTNGTFYWLQATQFPSVPNDPSLVQVVLANDSAGAMGSVIQTAGPAVTADSVTALVGKPAIWSTGANLALGGNFANVQRVSLFGPGGWLCTALAGTATGVSAGAWEGALNIGASGTLTNTYPNGPVTSFGAARIDLAPAGTVDALWRLYTGGAPAGTQAIPVQTGGNVVYAACVVKSSGLGNGATVSLKYTEYNSSGTAGVSGTLQTLSIASGNQVAWGSGGLSGHWTTAGTCAFVDLQIEVADTVAGNSANGTVWVDNVQAWDSTRLGTTTMPYCELTFPLAPAQLLVSGVLGDVPAPALVQVGYYAAALNLGHAITSYLGRRLIATANMQLVLPPNDDFTQGYSAALDATSWAGYTISGASPRGPYGAPSDMLGTFHLMAREQVTGTSFATASVVAAVYMRPLAPYLVPPNGQRFLAVVAGAPVTPYTAQNTWTLVDAGQVVLPPTTLPTAVDLSQNTLQVAALTQNGGAGTPTNAYVAMLPTDGEVLIAKVLNPANGAANLIAQWVWGYFDGGNSSTTYSLENTPIPNVARGGGATGTNTGVYSGLYISINPTGDTQMLLDPRQHTVTGGTLGVNQFCVVAADDAGKPLPAAVEMQYAPLYLFPL